jgi:hypothetical protein
MSNPYKNSINKTVDNKLSLIELLDLWEDDIRKEENNLIL